MPLSRFYGANRASLPQPFRSFQFGPVWRAERPAKGRYRQFNQCDIDMLGEPSVLAEVELIEATSAALAAAGPVRHDRAGVATAGSCPRWPRTSGVPAEGWDRLFITLDKLDKIGWDGVRKELADRVGLDEPHGRRGSPRRSPACRALDATPSSPTSWPPRCPTWATTCCPT